MKRKEERELKKSEPKAILEFLKISNHFFSNFKEMLKNIKDPRRKNSVIYAIDEITAVLILKCIFNIISMREMTSEFNNDNCIENLGIIMGNDNLTEIPHYVTINDCLKKLDPAELENIRNKMIYALIRKRTFEDARLMGKYWCVIVDGTQLFSFSERHCEHCMTRTVKDKEDEEGKTRYYHNALEAKIILGDGLVVSLATEFIENESASASKQDCELKAFKRLQAKLKASFPRLPICILADSLYASKTFFDICEDNHWQYILRFKDGSIPSVAEEFHSLKKWENAEFLNQIIKIPQIDNRIKDESKKLKGYDVNEYKIKWVNDIDYKGIKLSVMECKAKEIEEEKTFLWISNMKIKKNQAYEMMCYGRKRWGIENEGFNIQKNNRYDITHANSLNYNAMKCHYLIIQIADILLQLYENGSEFVKILDKTIKNISSDLLKSFVEHTLTEEDIFQTIGRMHYSIT